MEWSFSTTETFTARKNYECDACGWLNIDLSYVIELCTFTEKKQIVKARGNNWQIKKGQKYIKVKGIWEGEWSVYRAIPEIQNIIDKYKLCSY